jgi:hypothetical protein
VSDDDVIGRVIAEVGAPYGMTGADVAAHLIMGDRHHPDAPESVCGAVDPRREDRWCVLAPDHRGEDHSCYGPTCGCCRTWNAAEQAHPEEFGPRAAP